MAKAARSKKTCVPSAPAGRLAPEDGAGPRIPNWPTGHECDGRLATSPEDRHGVSFPYKEHSMTRRGRRLGAVAMTVVLFGLSLPMAHPQFRGSVYSSVYGRHFSPSVAMPHHPYWACFG